jgi:hypothetical protein
MLFMTLIAVIIVSLVNNNGVVYAAPRATASHILVKDYNTPG